MTVADTVESYTEAMTDTLADMADALDSDAVDSDAVDHVEQAAGELVEDVGQLVNENERLESELSETRAELSETREKLADVRDQLSETREELEQTDKYARDSLEHAARERAELASRVSDLEETAENAVDGSVEPGSADDTPTPTPETGETGLHDTVRAETPLEEAVNFPPQVAERELSENRLRGRFLARDIKQYATNVQGGWTITPSDMRTVISAYQGGGSVHPETLRRVRDFLSRWGKNEVSIRQREDGTNVVVFSNEIVDRLVKITEPDHTVVTGETATVG